MPNKNCSRCQKEFSCQANDISNCQCNAIELDESCKTFLAKTNYDCLCINCLHELNTKTIKASQHDIKQGLIENLHYYWENGLMVFTEFHHISKGKCCENGCRHCAYGFKKEA